MEFEKLDFFGKDNVECSFLMCHGDWMGILIQFLKQKKKAYTWTVCNRGNRTRPTRLVSVVVRRLVLVRLFYKRNSYCGGRMGLSLNFTTVRFPAFLLIVAISFLVRFQGPNTFNEFLIFGGNFQLQFTLNVSRVYVFGKKIPNALWVDFPHASSFCFFNSIRHHSENHARFEKRSTFLIFL